MSMTLVLCGCIVAGTEFRMYHATAVAGALYAEAGYEAAATAGGPMNYEAAAPPPAAAFAAQTALLPAPAGQDGSCPCEFLSHAR